MAYFPSVDNTNHSLQVFLNMKQDDPERFVRLERLTKEAYADLRDLYGIGMTKVPPRQSSAGPRLDSSKRSERQHERATAPRNRSATCFSDSSCLIPSLDWDGPA